MPTNRELLLSLRDEFEQLELFDQARLNSLRERAPMIIERVFGENSSYYERLSNISFRRGGGSVAIISSFGGGGGETAAERQARERACLSGQQQSISLVDTTLEDLELHEPKQVQGAEDQIVPKSKRVFVVHGHDNEMKQGQRPARCSAAGSPGGASGDGRSTRPLAVSSLRSRSSSPARASDRPKASWTSPLCSSVSRSPSDLAG